MENAEPKSGRKVVLNPIKFGGSASPLMGEGCGDLCKSLPRTVADPGLAQMHTQRVQNDLTTRMKNQLSRTMTPSLTPGKGPG